jgi:hypothetical protein
MLTGAAPPPPPPPPVCGCRELCANEPGRGPDVVIEAVGFHYTKSMLHTIEVVSGALYTGKAWCGMT